jgi:fatty aldehyde-generating acyl-ACP reductase
MYKFLKRLVADFFRIFLGVKTNQLTGYAFIVHPRDINDVTSNIPFLKLLPRSLVLKLFYRLWPFTVSGIYGLKSTRTGQAIPGWVIGVPMFAHQMMESRQLARKRISQAVRLARHKGAKVIGLGALTGSLTEGGAGMTKSGETLVTAGRAYTAFVVKSYVDDALQRFELQPESITIAVVGAAGGVGRAVTKLLLRESYRRIILVDLERKLESILEHQTPTHVELTHKISAVKEADIIITVTNAPEAVVTSDDIKPGAIIIDDAQPSDISPEVINSRDDIIVIEAGVITTGGGIKVGTNFRLANKDEIYCCLGEVMAIAANDWAGEYQPHNITPEVIDDISTLSKQTGFKLAPYQAFGKMVSPAQIARVKEIIKSR